jgi:ribosomal protein S14
MVSKLTNIKNYNKKKILNNNYLNYIFIKSITENSYFSKKITSYYYKLFTFLLFYNKVHKSCLLTYRSKGTFNFFNLTRMMFKYYAVNKYLSGIVKSSW